MYSPDPKPGKPLPKSTVELVKAFYLSDEVSRVMPGKKDYVSVTLDTGVMPGKKDYVSVTLDTGVMPGKKDYVSVTLDTGVREHHQKRLVLCNLKEAYTHFKTVHPVVKVGFS